MRESSGRRARRERRREEEPPPPEEEGVGAGVTDWEGRVEGRRAMEMLLEESRLVLSLAKTVRVTSALMGFAQEMVEPFTEMPWW